VSETAIEHARAGVYPASITAESAPTGCDASSRAATVTIASASRFATCASSRGRISPRIRRSRASTW
jgi:hypothetical protein